MEGNINGWTYGLIYCSLYDANIHQSERSTLKVVCNEMTYNIFVAICQGLLEQDKMIFALLLALEIEDSHGNFYHLFFINYAF